jgi:hypothetical protein
MGETKIETVTWEVKPSVSPGATHVQLHIEYHGPKYASAWIYMDAEQARDLGDELLEAATWCRKKDAC